MMKDQPGRKPLKPRVPVEAEADGVGLFAGEVQHPAAVRALRQLADRQGFAVAETADARALGRSEQSRRVQP